MGVVFDKYFNPYLNPRGVTNRQYYVVIINFCFGENRKIQIRGKPTDKIGDLLKKTKKFVKKHELLDDNLSFDNIHFGFRTKETEKETTTFIDNNVAIQSIVPWDK